ncbi:MAG: ATP-binding cassette domain-containing protein [Desulfobacterales bacterium]|nr:ATP-binding cassette domain-containing protein [Desulfobacterales bacterium]
MIELFRRLFHRPVLAAEILAATLFTTLLTLAMPMYVIQVLNRYVSYGFHGTLITLTIGMCIAALLQFCFRLIRTKMAAAVNQTPNNRLSEDILALISRAKAEPMARISKPKIQEALNHVQTIQQTYTAQNLNATLDAPFSLILIFVIYLLSPLLAGIALAGIGVALILGWITLLRSKKTGEKYAEEMSAHKHLNFSAVNNLEAVRAFCAAPFLSQKWQGQLNRLSRLNATLSDYREISQTMTMTGSALTSVFIYAVGALLVVKGDLSVGALIGANILSGRAYQNTTKLVQAVFALSRAKQAFSFLSGFTRMPMESTSGTALKSYTGQLEFHDLGFAYPNTTTPVFESLNLTLAPGSVLGVTGDNGVGKTTLAKLIVTLLEPKRGSIMADGVNLAQMAPAWWRRQLIYMPQEPEFIAGTLKENILMLNPELPQETLNEILKTADLRTFLDRTPEGLETPVTDNEKNFPPGVRRRLSLARALASEGKIALLDEPTDALDQKGVEAVYRVMNQLARAGKTIVVFTNDPRILKGTGMILNLNRKPVPEIIRKPDTAQIKSDHITSDQAGTA